MYLCYEPVFFLPFNRQKRNPDVAHDKPYYLLDPLLANISYFFVFLFFYLRILLKWTTHLDVRAVSNLLYSFTTFFLAAPFLFAYQQCLPFQCQSRPASNFLCVCTQFAFRWSSECPYYYFFFNPDGFFFFLFCLVVERTRLSSAFIKHYQELVLVEVSARAFSSSL